MSCNSEAFTPEEIEKGLHLDLLKLLLDYNKINDKHYKDIHITTDGYCLIVEWTTKYYDDADLGGSFEYVDEDSEVMKTIEYPDGHYEYIHMDEDAKIYLDEWLKENPGWKKNDWGRWTKVDEYAYDEDEVDTTEK